MALASSSGNSVSNKHNWCRWCTNIGLIVAIIVVVLAFFIGFIIGYFRRPSTGGARLDANVLAKMTGDATPEITERILALSSAQSISEFHRYADCNILCFISYAIK